MSRTKEYLDELIESGRLIENDSDVEYEEYVNSLNAMNELFNIAVEESEQDETEVKTK